MMTNATWHRFKASIAPAWLFALLVGIAALAGCGTVQFETGRKFDPSSLERSLKTGVSTQTDLKTVLGKPYGKGRALMPFHPSDRTVWTYYYEQGSVDVGSGNLTDQRLYLFVFIDGDRYDGYMWFASKLN